VLWLYVGLGGFAGTLTRYALGGVVQRWTGSVYPWQTLLINVTGSFLLGFLVRYALGAGDVRPEWRAALTTGFCGGYTTFSTFAYESARLIEDREWLALSSYILLSVVGALIATFAGFAMADWVLRIQRSG
jgi:CrcB protein